MVQHKFKKFYSHIEEGIGKTPEDSADKKIQKKRRKKNYKPDWTVYKISSASFSDSPSMYFFQTYNLHDNMRALPIIRGEKPNNTNMINVGTSSGFIELSDLVLCEEPVGYTKYAGSGLKSGAITTYLLYATQLDLIQAARNMNKRIDLRSIPQEQLEESIDENYTIKSKHVDLSKYQASALGVDLNVAFKQINRHDISKFCGKNQNKSPNQNTGFEIVDELVNSPSLIQIKTIKPNKKFEMVLQGKGEYESHTICKIQIGIDYMKGCFAGLTPDGKYAPELRCTYCYAQQNASDSLQTMFEFTAESLAADIKTKALELGIAQTAPLVLRLGQRVEMNIPRVIREKFGLDNRLNEVLRAVEILTKERAVQTIMPTKAPDFEDTTIELLKKANVSVIVSIAYDVLEPGIVGFGYTDERRLEYLRQLRHEGINANIYLTTDMSRPMRLMQPGGHKVHEWMAKNSDLGVGVQYLEARITRSADAPVIGGAAARILTNKHHWSRNHYDSLGLWGKTGLNYLYHLTTHPDFNASMGQVQGLNTKSEYRGCRTTGNKNDHNCGVCFIDKSRKIYGNPSRNVIQLGQVI